MPSPVCCLPERPVFCARGIGVSSGRSGGCSDVGAGDGDGGGRACAAMGLSAVAAAATAARAVSKINSQEAFAGQKCSCEGIQRLLHATASACEEGCYHEHQYTW